MTGIAAYGGMGAGKLEFSVFVMIENERFPFPLVMALLALPAVAPGMHVINTMAGHTFRSQIFVVFIGVATIAGGFLVLAVQRKFGFVVIEAAGLPGLDAMTLFTGFTETPLVRVIFVMAVIAC